MGRLASQVVCPDEIRSIFLAYRGNGGGLSYEQIEKAFDLKPTNGMTAYRIIQKAKKIEKAAKNGGGHELKVESWQDLQRRPPKKEVTAIDILMASAATSRGA